MIIISAIIILQTRHKNNLSSLVIA